MEPVVWAMCLTVAMFALVMGASASATPSPPGSNDFNCRPSTAHPYPVVLVHGTFGNQTTMAGISFALKADGYCVFSLDYGGYGLAPLFGIYATGPIDSSARQLDSFIDRVRAATGAGRTRGRPLAGRDAAALRDQVPGRPRRRPGGTRAVESRHDSQRPVHPGLVFPRVPPSSSSAGRVRRVRSRRPASSFLTI